MQALRWLALVFAAACAVAPLHASAQAPAQPPVQNPGPAAPVQAPGSAQRSSFANPAEYDSYMAALNTKDPARKAQAMEVFIAWYPGSILRLEAHEQAISAWQAANQPAKADVLVARLLQIDPDNLRALANRAYVGRLKASGGEAAALAGAVTASQRGLAVMPKWQKPALLDDAGFAKVKEQLAGVFNGVGSPHCRRRTTTRRGCTTAKRSLPIRPICRMSINTRSHSWRARPSMRWASGMAPARSPSPAPPRAIRPRRTSIVMSARATASIAAARRDGTRL
jgi:hypothetical protein